MRIALATFAGLPDLDEDGVLLHEALEDAGAAAEPAVWDDPALDWASYDRVVVRSTWDYHLRREEFLAWAARVPRVANPAHVLTWNTDKTYLRELAAAGVPVVPTTWLPPGTAYEPVSGEVVVKPAVGAGAADTGRFVDHSDAAALVARLHAQGRTAMVQPYLSDVDTAGETAVVVLGGELSHAARKGPLLVPGARPRQEGDPYGEVITAREPSEEELAVARAALAAAPGPLLYARVDLVPGPDGPVVLELELTEPSLFLRSAPGAARRLAAAVLEH